MTVAVLSTLALKGVLDRFRAELAQSLGEALETRFDATQAILKQLETAGAWPDLVILTEEAMQELTRRGDIRESRVLGSSGVGLAVRKGAPRPDIGTLESFKQAIAGASSVAHSKVGASGLYFAGLVETIPLTLKKRIVVEKGPVGRVVAAGEAEIGIQQLCELAPVPGIDIVGPLPDPIQRITRFSAGIPVNATNRDGASKLLDMLNSHRLRAGMREGGIEPA